MQPIHSDSSAEIMSMNENEGLERLTTGGPTELPARPVRLEVESGSRKSYRKH